VSANGWPPSQFQPVDALAFDAEHEVPCFPSGATRRGHLFSDRWNPTWSTAGKTPASTETLPLAYRDAGRSLVSLAIPLRGTFAIQNFDLLGHHLQGQDLSGTVHATRLTVP
jgi:hypothetical protein